MKKIITALGNQVLNNELKKINEFEIVANDLQYKEAIIELLEINKNVNYIISVSYTHLTLPTRMAV